MIKRTIMFTRMYVPKNKKSVFVNRRRVSMRVILTWNIFHLELVRDRSKFREKNKYFFSKCGDDFFFHIPAFSSPLYGGGGVGSGVSGRGDGSILAAVTGTLFSAGRSSGGSDNLHAQTDTASGGVVVVVLVAGRRIKHTRTQHIQ